MSRPLTFEEVDNKTISLPVLVAGYQWHGVNVEVVRDHRRLMDLLTIYDGVVNVLVEDVQEVYIKS